MIPYVICPVYIYITDRSKAMLRLWLNMSIDMRNPVSCHMRTTKAQISLRIRFYGISAFIVRCLDSMISILSICTISRLWLVSVAEQTGLCLTWSQTPNTGFVLTRLISLSLFAPFLFVLYFCSLCSGLASWPSAGEEPFDRFMLYGIVLGVCALLRFDVLYRMLEFDFIGS